MQKKANHLAAACLSVLTLTAAIGMPAVSAEHYNVYNYDCWGEATPSQAGYEAQRSVSGLDLGSGHSIPPRISFVTGTTSSIL